MLLSKKLAAKYYRVIDHFRQWDVNDDGVISESEFVRMMQVRAICGQVVDIRRRGRYLSGR